MCLSFLQNRTEDKHMLKVKLSVCFSILSYKELQRWKPWTINLYLLFRLSAFPASNQGILAAWDHFYIP